MRITLEIDQDQLSRVLAVTGAAADCGARLLMELSCRDGMNDSFRKALGKLGITVCPEGNE